MVDATRKCAACDKTKKLDASEFKLTRDGFTAVCKQCSENRKASRDKKKANLDGDKENPNATASTAITEEEQDEEEREHWRKELGNVTLEQFTNAILATEDIQSLIAFVDLSELVTENDRGKADKLTAVIWEQSKYCFVWVAINF